MLSALACASYFKTSFWPRQALTSKRAERGFETSSSGLTSAAQQNANSNACNVSEADAAGLNGDLRVDMHALQAFDETAARILKEERFAELDCLADHARSGKERLPGGLWKIHLLYAGLSQPVPYPMHPTQEDWTNLLQRLQKWVKAS